VPRSPGSPLVGWTKKNPILLFEDVTHLPKGGKTVRLRKPRGVRAVYILSRDKDEPIWKREKSKNGFDFEAVGEDRFILSDGISEALFEVK
jgi:hypothetical protein